MVFQNGLLNLNLSFVRQCLFDHSIMMGIEVFSSQKSPETILKEHKQDKPTTDVRDRTMQLIVSDAEEKDCEKSSEITMESPECNIMQNKVLDTFKINHPSDVDMNQPSDGNASDEPMDVDNSIIEPDIIDREITEENHKEDNVKIDSHKNENNSIDDNVLENKGHAEEDKEKVASNTESTMDVDENIVLEANQSETVSESKRNNAVDNKESVDSLEILTEKISELKSQNESEEPAEKEMKLCLEDSDDISLHLEDDGDHESSGNVSFDLEKELNIEKDENVSFKEAKDLSIDSEQSSDINKDTEHAKIETISTDLERNMVSGKIENVSMSLDKVTEDTSFTEDNSGDFITLNLSPDFNQSDETDLCTIEQSKENIECEATKQELNESVECEAANNVSNENVESKATNDVSNENEEIDATNDVSNENVESKAKNDVSNENVEIDSTNDVSNDATINVSNEKIESKATNDGSNKNVEIDAKNDVSNENVEIDATNEVSNENEKQLENVITIKTCETEDIKSNDNLEKPVLDNVVPHATDSPKKSSEMNSNEFAIHTEVNSVLEANVETDKESVTDSVNKTKDSSGSEIKQAEKLNETEVQDKKVTVENKLIVSEDLKKDNVTEKSNDIELSLIINGESNTNSTESENSNENKNEECGVLKEIMETSDIKESEMVVKSKDIIEGEISEENMEISDIKETGTVVQKMDIIEEGEILEENMEISDINKESEKVVKSDDTSNSLTTKEESNVFLPELKNKDSISATIEKKDSFISQDNTKPLKSKEIEIDAKKDSSIIIDDEVKKIDLKISNAKEKNTVCVSVEKSVKGLQSETKDNTILSTEGTVDGAVKTKEETVKTRDGTEGTVSKEDGGVKNVSSNNTATSETMVLSDDDDDVALKISSDENNMESIKGELKRNKKIDNVGSRNENKPVVKSNSKTDQATNTEEKTKDNICLAVDDDDDDDLVLIDDSSSKTSDSTKIKVPEISLEVPAKIDEESKMDIDKDPKTVDENPKPVKDFPICPLTIMKKIKPALDAMSRDDLEEFLVVKIVESISGRSAISDIQLKLKSQEKSMEEWRKKVMTLSKQNKDLTIVLRNLLEEQQKKLKDNPIPIKITRSVGLQVGYPSVKAPATPASSNVTSTNSSQVGTEIISSNISRQVIKPQPQPTKLVTTPAVNNVVTRRGRTRQSSSNTTPNTSTPSPTPSSVGSNTSSQAPTPHITVRSKRLNLPIAPKLVPVPAVPVANKTATSAPARPLSKQTPEIHQKTAEKRPSLQSIDLTDDEPPAKIQAIRTPPRPVPTIRPVNTSQLTSPNKLTYIVNGAGTAGTGARPVYIPINAQGQNVQPNSIMMRGKVLNKINIRQLTNTVRVGQPIPIRPAVHPAPLPQSINSKAQLHPTWKWIPPRPTLKIAKVENGIVISWEMDDFSEAQHEPIASYQIFAYQEASTQPTTDLWKKIGDVKALPLPMACTLTHFMSGFKYYFAVRAIDIRTRVGPFSAPGNITLMNKK